MKSWIIRALGPVDLAPFFIETWWCDLCDYLFHRFDCVNASVEARGDEWEMEGQGMIRTLCPYLDAGRIRIFCINGVQPLVSPPVSELAAP